MTDGGIILVCAGGGGRRVKKEKVTEETYFEGKGVSGRCCVVRVDGEKGRTNSNAAKTTSSSCGPAQARWQARVDHVQGDPSILSLANS